MQRNREKFENPEVRKEVDGGRKLILTQTMLMWLLQNSIYYHPTLNPFGAPPPGKPQMFRQVLQPSGPTGLPRNPCHGQPSQHQHLERPPQRRFQDRLPLPRIERRLREPRGMARRPGKRPPLPLDPPPPGTIQVPCRPPLPSGVIPVRPPPPPPTHVQLTATISLPASSLVQQTHQEVLPPSIPMVAVAAVDGNRQEVADTDEDNVVAPYSTTEEHTVDDCRVEDEQVMDEDAAERRAQLCSLVPVALRVHRQVPVTSSSAAIVGSVPSVITRRRTVPAPRTSVLQPARSVDVAPSVPRCPTTTTTSANSSMSKEYDAFIEDMKELL